MKKHIPYTLDHEPKKITVFGLALDLLYAVLGASVIVGLFVYLLEVLP